MKADLKAVIQDYGFGSWTVVLSVVNATDGTPIQRLRRRTFNLARG